MAGRRLRRPLRWLRALLLVSAIGFLALTFAALVFNRLTTPRDTFATPTGVDVNVDDRRVHYQQWGSTGSPIVLIGGALESTASWSLVAPDLARDHVVYAVDLAGYGYTEYDGHYSLSDETALVRGFVRTLHLAKPLLVGHSLGAAVVGSVALADPGSIRGVVFADGDAMPFRGPQGRGSVAGFALRTPYATSLYRIGTRWSWLAEKVVRTECGSVCRGFSPELVEAWFRPLRQGAAEQALPRIAAAGVLHLNAAQTRSIAVPRGIIWGAEDSTGGGSLAAAQRNLGNPRTIRIAHAGHLSMVADPAAFADAVRQLDSVRVRSSNAPTGRARPLRRPG